MHSFKPFLPTVFLSVAFFVGALGPTIAQEPHQILTGPVDERTKWISPSPAPERPAPPSFRSTPPPNIIKGIYLSFWSTTLDDRMENVVQLARNGAINAVVIDVKDAAGRVGFDTEVPEAISYRARHRVIRDLGALVARLHDAGLYVVARIVVFTDPILAKARPDLAVHSRAKLFADAAALSEATLWLDERNLAWLDPGAKEVWDYNVAIARDVVRSGVDELNFDYIRFPTDGDLNDMHFPFTADETPKRQVIRSFFAYLREQLPDARLSADLFGLVTVTRDDLGIGQVVEDVYDYFDYVCPMVYPSHYADGYNGFENPAEHPYEVVYSALKGARERLTAHAATSGDRARLRPWLQDFDIGAVYDGTMVKKQIRGVEEAMGEDYSGFLLWSPSNRYSTDALD